MILPTKWGDFQYHYESDGTLVVEGQTKLGDQLYAICLRMSRGEFGWGRNEYDDLRITKVGGGSDGKPARLSAREIIVDYLPEHVNSVIGGE